MNPLTFSIFCTKEKWVALWNKESEKEMGVHYRCSWFDFKRLVIDSFQSEHNHLHSAHSVTCRLQSVALCDCVCVCLCLAGIVTEGESEEVFSSQLEQLRCVLKKRTAVYSAEEKALMVMLEGEQEEERRREQEKRVTREREKQLQRKLRVEAMLFGGKTWVQQRATKSNSCVCFTECCW